MYKVGPYFWAKISSELPFSIMMPSIFGCIVYFCVGLNSNNAGCFFVYLLMGLSMSKKPLPLKMRPYQPSML